MMNVDKRGNYSCQSLSPYASTKESAQTVHWTWHVVINLCFIEQGRIYTARNAQFAASLSTSCNMLDQKPIYQISFSFLQQLIDNKSVTTDLLQVDFYP